MECPMYEQCLKCYCWALGASSRTTHATLQVKSAGELTLTTMMRVGTRVMTRQSRDDFVPGRGIMLDRKSTRLNSSHVD